MSEKQHTTEQLEEALEKCRFVKYAGAAYEVVDVTNELGCQFVRIYDEPPSKHVDMIKLSSVELINVPDLLAKVEALRLLLLRAEMYVLPTEQTNGLLKEIRKALES